MIRFKLKYALTATALFLLLAFIAIYVHDQFVRPFLGDVLVVVFLYYFLQSWLDISPIKLTLGVLLFAYSIEISQYFNIVEILGLQDINVAVIIIGSTFDVMDLVAYTLGALFIIFALVPKQTNISSMH